MPRIAILLMLVSILSCSDDDSNPIASDTEGLVGTWRLVTYQFGDGDIQSAGRGRYLEIYMTFNEDATYSSVEIEGGDLEGESSGTYTTTGDTLAMVGTYTFEEAEEEEEILVLYAVQGSTLDLTWFDSDDGDEPRLGDITYTYSKTTNEEICNERETLFAEIADIDRNGGELSVSEGVEVELSDLQVFPVTANDPVSGAADPVMDNDLAAVREAGRPYLSPNGDGVNDESWISVNVDGLSDTRVVRLTVTDLDGEEARRTEMSVDDGHFVIAWDGRGDDGQLLSDGTYMLHLTVTLDDVPQIVYSAQIDVIAIRLVPLPFCG